MPTFITTIKSHGEFPDFERITKAENFRQAVDKLLETTEFDEDTLAHNTEEVEDQPAEYGDDGQGNYN